MLVLKSLKLLTILFNCCSHNEIDEKIQRLWDNLHIIQKIDTWKLSTYKYHRTAGVIFS